MSDTERVEVEVGEIWVGDDGFAVRVLDPIGGAVSFGRPEMLSMPAEWYKKARRIWPIYESKVPHSIALTMRGIAVLARDNIGGKATNDTLKLIAYNAEAALEGLEVEPPQEHAVRMPIDEGEVVAEGVCDVSSSGAETSDGYEVMDVEVGDTDMADALMRFKGKNIVVRVKEVG